VLHAPAGADGAYRLALAEGGRYLLVAVADGARPASRVVDVRDGALLEVDPFVLETGAAVSGRVTLTGGRPAAAAVVTAEARRGDGLRLEIPETPFELMWTGRGVEHRIARGTAGADGRYEVAGLVPATYRVACASIPDAHSALTDSPIHGPRFARDAAAPATGVDFVVDLAVLELFLQGVPKGIAVVKQSGRAWESGSYVAIEAAEPLRMGVRPEGSFTLEVRADGCEPVKRAWTSPAAGETDRVEMTLTPRAAGALVLRLDPDAVLPGRTSCASSRSASHRASSASR